jgi:hypothetical protein
LIFKGFHGVTSQKIDLFIGKSVEDKKESLILMAANNISYLIKKENGVFIQLL